MCYEDLNAFVNDNQKWLVGGLDLSVRLERGSTTIPYPERYGNVLSFSSIKANSSYLKCFTL